MANKVVDRARTIEDTCGKRLTIVFLCYNGMLKTCSKSRVKVQSFTYSTDSFHQNHSYVPILGHVVRNTLLSFCPCLRK